MRPHDWEGPGTQDGTQEYREYQVCRTCGAGRPGQGFYAVTWCMVRGIMRRASDDCDEEGVAQVLEM